MGLPTQPPVRCSSDTVVLGRPLPKVKLYTPRKERMASSGRANSVPAAVNRQTSLDPLCNPDVKPDAAAVGDARVSDSPGGTPYSSGFYQPTSTAAPAGADRQAPLESLCNPNVKPSDAPDASATAGRETTLERARETARAHVGHVAVVALEHAEVGEAREACQSHSRDAKLARLRDVGT